MSTIDEKLSLVKYKPETTSHIGITEELCIKCRTKECTFFCPARVYSIASERMENENSESRASELKGRSPYKIENGEIPNIEYENCLECGACVVGCMSNSIKWVCPKGGKGVLYKFS